MLRVTPEVVALEGRKPAHERLDAVADDLERRHQLAAAVVQDSTARPPLLVGGEAEEERTPTHEGLVVGVDARRGGAHELVENLSLAAGPLEEGARRRRAGHRSRAVACGGAALLTGGRGCASDRSGLRTGSVAIVVGYPSTRDAGPSRVVEQLRETYSQRKRNLLETRT